MLAYELSAEIDREVIGVLKNLAQYGGVKTWTYTSGGAGEADGRWQHEIFLTFYTQLVFAANEIAKATRRGAGNTVICSPNVAAMLTILSLNQSNPIDSNIDTSVMGTAKIGRIGAFNVYRDMFADDDYAVVLYKGAEDNDNALVFCPYVPVTFAEGTGEENFQPRMGCMTRYGLATHLLGSENYARYIDVDLSGAFGAFTESSSGSNTVSYVTSGGTT